MNVGDRFGTSSVRLHVTLLPRCPPRMPQHVRLLSLRAPGPWHTAQLRMLAPMHAQGLWVANYQAEYVDLSTPGQVTQGRSIYIPTCGHRGQIIGAHHSWS